MAACLGVVFAVLVAAVTADLPNVVIILADDMGWGDVSYNNVSSKLHQPGAGRTSPFVPNPPRTPNLDAMARGPNSIMFDRFYSGSAVCSPTRATILTGRTNNRECISSAEGCGQEPAWSCYNPLPFPTTVFTIAEAAKLKGYSTMHVGKWHLGNFFPKHHNDPNWAQRQFPVSHPGMHGFDEWNSTEASASSSMCNCGCRKEWVAEGEGCVTGGGVFKHEAYACTNYWFPTDLDDHHRPSRPECHKTNTSTLSCTSNYTTKIPGDDSELQVDIFEDFVKRKTSAEEKSPFMALIWLHTNHLPHPAMPYWYHNYTDANGNPAGDYLGTISQMDVQIGRIRAILRENGVANNTLVWFTADNGPHVGGSDRVVQAATNGLRQCKASLFEGGIREPGILEWPAVIKTHRQTSFPASTVDYLPTFLDIIGMKHPQPTWYKDGMSLLPLIEGKIPDSSARPNPLGFNVGGQTAWIDNDWKVVLKPSAGQCGWEEPYKSMKDKTGPFLFNLKDDPMETHDVSKENKEITAKMVKDMEAFAASIEVSQRTESQCKAPTPGPPGPPPPPPPSVHLQKGTQCLVAASKASEAAVKLGACDDPLASWTEMDNGIYLASVATDCAKNIGGKCAAGNGVHMGNQECGSNSFVLDAGVLKAYGCGGQYCLGVSGTNSATLVDCSDPSATGWTKA